MLSYLQSIFQSSSTKRQNYLNEQIKIKQNNLKRKVYEELNFLQQLEEYKQISQNRKQQIRQIKSAKKLNEMIIKKEVSCVELIIIFGEIALSEGFKMNLITDCYIKEAYMKAKEKDKNLEEYLKRENRSIFYGLAISIKDNVIKKGSDSTLGCASYVNNEQEEDGVLVGLIEEELMGIIIVKSNVPQLNMLNESLNEIFGAAENPLDISRTPGGSSGGESALVYLGASILGIGTDIGGSLRGPAASVGCVSLKPSEIRTSNKGLFFPNPYNLRPNLNIIGIPGCIVNNTYDLIQFQKAFFNSNIISSYDYTKSITPFNSLLFDSTLTKPKIRLAYLVTDSYFKVCNSIQRGIQEIVKKLQQDSRFELVDIMDINIDNKYFNSQDIIENYLGIMGAEGGLKNFLRILKGDKILKEYDLMIKASRIPRYLRGSVSWLLRMLGQKRIGQMVKYSYGRSYDEFQELSLKQQIMQQKMYEMLIEHKLDGIMLPCSVTPAIKHHQSQQLFIHCYYTFIFNLFKMPAAVLPLTQVRQDEQFYSDSNNNDNLTKLTHQQMINSKGLPVSIQIAALPNQDEKLLAILQILESKIQFSHQSNL